MGRVHTFFLKPTAAKTISLYCIVFRYTQESERELMLQGVPLEVPVR
jgi:hypothetical protein